MVDLIYIGVDTMEKILDHKLPPECRSILLGAIRATDKIIQAEYDAIIEATGIDHLESTGEMVLITPDEHQVRSPRIIFPEDYSVR